MTRALTRMLPIAWHIGRFLLIVVCLCFCEAEIGNALVHEKPSTL